jgi:hypothetical protein
MKSRREGGRGRTRRREREGERVKEVTEGEVKMTVTARAGVVMNRSSSKVRDRSSERAAGSETGQAREQQGQRQVKRESSRVRDRSSERAAGSACVPL